MGRYKLLFFLIIGDVIFHILSIMITSGGIYWYGRLCDYMSFIMLIFTGSITGIFLA